MSDLALLEAAPVCPTATAGPSRRSVPDRSGISDCAGATPCDAGPLPPLQPVFSGLGDAFGTPVFAKPIPEPSLVHFNAPLAEALGFGVEPNPQAGLIQILAGNLSWPGYAPYAMVYAGHQFGNWVPQLGDGRALLIAEIRTPFGARQELQLKGSGPTPYSRGLDGRAVLRSSIREYLCSEAMHALGVPTTRCLSLIASTEPVQRETTERAAVVCRTSPSFVRFGHFEYFSQSGQHRELAMLADHVIDGHFPHLRGQPQRHSDWLIDVVERTARLMAHWQSLGFCHGVMNTDNFSVLGLTLDYGPFAFMDRFRQHHVCNHSDFEGRYAYNAQPQVGEWNCSRLLRACLPLLADDKDAALEIANAVFERYAPAYTQAMQRRWCDKLGLLDLRDGDRELVNAFLAVLQRGKSDFTRSFRRLALVEANGTQSGAGLRDEMADREGFDRWIVDYRARLRGEQAGDDLERARRMNRVNPHYVLRNHLAQIAIERAERGDYSEVGRLMELLRRPFDEQPAHEAYAEEPPAERRSLELSCSS